MTRQAGPGSRVTVQELGLGEMRASYPLFSVLVALLLVASVPVLLILIILFQSSPVAGAAALLALIGLVVGWRRLTARYRMHRCCICQGGLVTTSWLGRVRDWVPWSDVSDVKVQRARVNGTAHVYNLHLRRADGTRITLLMMRRNEKLLRDINESVAKAGPSPGDSPP